MHRYLGIAAIALAAYMLSSCSDDRLDYSDDSTRGQIIARMEQPAVTRTAVGDAVDGTDAVGIVWTDGDEIGVFGASGTAQKRYAKVGQGTAPTAAFAADGTTPFDSPAYAYYPYDEANASHNVRELVGTLPLTQEMGDGKLHGDYKIGSPTEPAADGSYVFEFKHLFSLAHLIIDATGTPLQGESLKSLTVSVSRNGSGVPVAGDFTFNAENGTWAQSGDGQNSITLTWNTSAPALDETVECYMSLFPVVRPGDTFTITATTDSYRAEFEASSLTDFEAEQIYHFPVTLSQYETIKVYDGTGAAVQGKFTCAALNVDGLPVTINSGGPGESGTETIGRIMNGLGYDFIAVSEDFEYHDNLTGAMSNYNMGTYRGSVSNPFGKNDTDGLEFFWKKDGISATGETMVEFNESYGGLLDGANELIAKGFRHYVVTVAEGVDVDVYITHMNTFGDGGNTEEDPHVHAQMSQLRQLRDYVIGLAKTNKRPAIIMGDTNMRYTRHQIKSNLIDAVAAEEGLLIADPWIELRRDGVYPEWDSGSLMIRSMFNGDPGDILCSDDQRGEVVDKMWYINVQDAPVQLRALSCMNNVDDFAASTEQVSYSGVTVEDAEGNILTGEDVSYTKVNGYADHFPVVVSFEFTRSH